MLQDVYDFTLKWRVLLQSSQNEERVVTSATAWLRKQFDDWEDHICLRSK